MTTRTESFTTFVAKTRNAAEKTAEAVKKGVHQTAERAQDLTAQRPRIDISDGVQRYFEFVQKAVDTNREFALTWADAVTSLSGLVREQADKVNHLVTEEADKFGDRLIEQADKVEHATREQAGKVEHATREQAG